MASSCVLNRHLCVLKVLLDQDGLSAEGTFEELCDRRLGFDMMKADPGLDVPV